MDISARCGMTSRTGLVTDIGQIQQASLSIEIDSDNELLGFISLVGSCGIDTEILGLDFSQPFNFGIAYSSDPIGDFTFSTLMPGDDITDSLQTALEFDSGNGAGISPVTVDFASVMARQYFGF